MLKSLLVIPLVLAVAGCASQVNHANTQTPENKVKFTVPEAACLGDTSLPPSLVGKFEAVDDPALLANAIAPAGQGKLCQGQVYQAKAGESITIYRAWNSRNSYTRLGSWWAPMMPSGKTASYQTNYEICYTWSPLDKMVKCQLKPGTKVVIGTGQSTSCPPPPPAEYPKTYILPVSAKKQIYIENTADVTLECSNFDNQFNWAAEQQ